ncbi:MAG: PadR family transcriptional regulator [Acidimicrobiales bacterium]
MLELAILGLLVEEDLHGYELKRRLTEALGALSSVSYGSLYPALGRLEKAAAVKVVTAVPPADEPAVPGSHGAARARVRPRAASTGQVRGGRTRKVYGITDRGRTIFSELLSGEVASLDDEREFTLRFAFARFLPPEARVRLLERRRALLVERLTKTRGRSGRDSYAAALLEHGAATTERDISWLDDLIARERAQTMKGNAT